jgi:hypothetical protein
MCSTYAIEGMVESEAKALLAELIADATRFEFNPLRRAMWIVGSNQGSATPFPTT